MTDMLYPLDSSTFQLTPGQMTLCSPPFLRCLAALPGFGLWAICPPNSVFIIEIIYRQEVPPFLDLLFDPTPAALSASPSLLTSTLSINRHQERDKINDKGTSLV